MKKLFLLIGVLLLAGCTEEGGELPLIKADAESDYDQHYQDLGIGRVYNYEFRLPAADNRSVHVWVEGYRDGEKISEAMVELSYGGSPEKEEEGDLGIGWIQSEDGSLLHLYAPGISATPKDISLPLQEEGIGNWEYAIQEDWEEFSIGKELLLGAYRHSSNGTMQVIDLKEDEQVRKMIEEDTTVLLMKMMVTDSS